MTKRKHSRMMLRIIAAAMAVALVSGTAVMTPIADIVGTNITAHASENIIAQGDYWKITDDDNDGNYKLTIFGTIPDTNENTKNIPWYGYRDKITEVTTENGAKTSADASYLFYSLENATSMDLSHLDTSAATDMKRMFCNCKKLTSLNLSGWDTSNVTNMNNMFYSCEKLDSLDVSGFDTSNVTNMNNMFSFCKSLTSLDLSGKNWDTSSVTGMGSMFYHCENLTSLNLSGFNTSSVTTMSFMFASCLKLTSLDLSGFDTSNVIYMNDMFKDSLTFTELDLSSFNTAKVQQIQDMFQSCSNLKTITVGNGWNTGSVTYSAYMFKDCTALVGGKGTAYNADVVDVTYAKVDGGTSAPGYLTQSPIIAQGSYWKVTDEDSDGNYKLTIFGTIPNTGGGSFTPPWNSYRNKITEVTTENGAKASADASYLFYYLTNATSIDLSHLDTSAVTSMEGMFFYCSSLTSIDVSSFDTSNVKDFYVMFLNCTNLVSVNVDGLVTSSATNIEGVFNRCSKLTEVDLSTWDTSGVTNAQGVFFICKSLKTIYVGNGWDLSNVTSDTDYMFDSCTSLVGGKGTKYDSTKTDKTYAKADGGEENPGYFTANTCTVTWKNGDTILETDTDVEKGTTPSYDGETPTKDSTAQYNYTFAGWTSDGGTTVYTAETLPALTGSVTYTAVFDEELITYPFTVTSVEGATITVYDEKNASVMELSGDNSQQLDGAVGFTFTSNMELVFDGATVSQSIEKPPIYINSVTISINDGNIGNNSNIINESNKENGNTGNTLYKYTVTAVTAESVSVSVYQVDIDELTITAPDKTYTGSALTPVVVKDGENILVENTDYTVTYEDNTDVGTATAKITGKGKYKGEKTVEFAINPQDISALAVVVDLDGDGSAYSPTTYTADSEKPSITYDGKKYTPTAKLLFSNEEVPTDSYDVSITPAQDVDTYTITFTAKENTNFTGTRTFDWDITKADMTITMTDGLSFNRVGGKVAGECVDESKFAVTGAPDGSTTTLIYFSEQGLQLPKAPTEAGNYTVKAVVTNDNYNDGEATATFTIISNQSGDYYFLKTANNTMLITGYAGDSAETVIPETINGLPVTGIYYYAFEDSDITSITIPASVDMIYSYAFKNAKDLTDVYYEGSKTEWNKEVTVSNGNNLLKNATIHYALPENIYLDQTSLETTVGKSIRLLVSVSPVGTPADFTWESSDETVATVDENGNVTTLDFGTATITATADNGKTAVCELTVGHNGSNGIFEYTVSDDKKVTITKYIGTSDTVEVADKIDDMPIVAIAEGTFAETPVKTINYTGSKTMWNELTTEDLGDITVNYALPTSISLDETADVTKADTITLTPTVTPADTATTFTWKSANEEVATVDDKGVVTGIAYGTVNITATADNGKTATCAVTVTNIGEKDDFEYEIVSNDAKDTITITKYNGSAEEVNIPETINGIPVTVIGSESFKDNATMKDVIILLNVETIEEDAFAGCDSELNIHGYRRTDSERYATENDINFIAIPYPLENNSTISSTNVDVNKKVTVTGVGNEGTLSYKYAVYYKPTDSDTWTARQSYNKNNVVTLTFKEDGIYDICVKVKDTGGNVEKKYFVLTVTQPLTNTSTISANVITLGESFTVDMSAQDGSGTYEYAVETKPISETEWTIVSDYSADESVTITPDKAGVQNVCISVKDGFGTIKKKYFVVDVKYTAPSNISTISGDTIKVGESVTVNCAAENGSGTFQYGVYTKSVESAKWTTVQNFDENAEVAVTFDKPGIYQVCAKAMDTDGTIVKKYFAVEVTKDALLNKSTISASEIMAGESIDVNAVAEGGFGAYKYAVYYKLSESSKWTTVQQFDANGNVTITPTKAGRYDICVKVADETNEIVKKYFMAEVKYEQLVNKCTLSADEVNFGETLTVTANAENGSGEYKYAVYMKSTERTAWNTVQDFSEQTEINVTFKNKGAYDICIKVMDSYGTISKTYTSVYVK